MTGKASNSKPCLACSMCTFWKESEKWTSWKKNNNNITKSWDLALNEAYIIKVCKVYFIKSIYFFGSVLGLGEIEATKNETPFYTHIHACMPKFKTQIGLIVLQIWKALAPVNVLIVNPYKEALNLVIAFIKHLRNYDQLILIHHIYSPHKTDLHLARPLLEGKMLHLFS